MLRAVAPNVHHHLPGANSLSGERHDKETLRRWFERLGRVQPNLHLKVNNIWLKGWPWHTTVLCSGMAPRRCSTATLRTSTVVSQVITLRWSRIYAVDVFEDSQEAARGLAAQAAAGLEEAVRRTNCKLAEAQSEARAF